MYYIFFEYVLQNLFRYNEKHFILYLNNTAKIVMIEINRTMLDETTEFSRSILCGHASKIIFKTRIKRINIPKIIENFGLMK